MDWGLGLGAQQPCDTGLGALLRTSPCHENPDLNRADVAGHSQERHKAYMPNFPRMEAWSQGT